MKKLTIVIVSYNVCHYLEQCIVSAQRAAQGFDYEIYVVDNASSDDTVSFIPQRFGDAVHLIESQNNLGFSRANNLAIRQSQSEYVLLLNPDTFVAEDAFLRVLDFMDQHPKAGGVGVRMHNADGTLAPESRRGLPTPWVSFLKMLGFSRRYYMSDLSWDEPGRIEVMSGAFCMLRRETLDKVGLLDADFFMYGEDIDLSYRIMKGGFENWYVPADIVHYKGESTSKSSYGYVHVFYQAMLIFFRKHYGHLSFLVTLPITFAIYFRAFIALVHTLYWRVRAMLGLDRWYADERYCFVGSPTMLAECRQLAMRKGLEASFVDGSQLDAIADQLQPESYIVYDTDSISFAQLIRHASSMPSSAKMKIGTYTSTSKTLITQHNIIK